MECYLFSDNPNLRYTVRKHNILIWLSENMWYDKNPKMKFFILVHLISHWILMNPIWKIASGPAHAPPMPRLDRRVAVSRDGVRMPGTVPQVTDGAPTGRISWDAGSRRDSVPCHKHLGLSMAMGVAQKRTW